MTRSLRLPFSTEFSSRAILRPGGFGRWDFLCAVFEEPEGATVRIEELDCATTLCRIKLHAPDNDALERAIQHAFIYSNKRIGKAFDIPRRVTQQDGSTKANLYIRISGNAL